MTASKRREREKREGPRGFKFEICIKSTHFLELDWLAILEYIFQINLTFLDVRLVIANFSKHPIAPETGSPAYTRTRLAQSSGLKLKANTGYSASLSFLVCPVSHK